MMPAALLAMQFEATGIQLTEVAPDVPRVDVETGRKRIAGSELTVPTGSVWLRFHIPT